MNSNTLWTVQAMAEEKHPNKAPFKGVLTIVDSPSDKSPSGARGHRVILTHTAAKAALPGLIGMAVDFKAGWDGHDARQKVGVITEAYLEGKNLMVAGFIYAKDFKDIIPHLEKSTELMGMSYELHNAHVEDMNQKIWTLTRATFTGAAILYRSKAAYMSTSFGLLSKGRHLA